jgi:hypothetical protein
MPHSDTETISTKAFTIIVGTVTSLILTIVWALFVHLADVPMLVPYAVTCAMTVFVQRRARRILLGGATFGQIPYSAREKTLRWITAAILSHAVLVLLATIRVDLWWAWLLTLIALAGIEYVIARDQEYLLTRIAPPIAPPAIVRTEPIDVVTRPVEPTRSRGEQLVLDALARTTYVHTQIAGEVKELEYGVTCALRNPSIAAASEAAGVPVTKVEPLGPGAEVDIAVAVSEVLGKPIERSWVEIADSRYAGLVSMTITLKDVLSMAHPYPLIVEPAKPGSRITLGVRVNGQHATINPLQHVVIVGKSRSGKTSLVNSYLAGLGRLRGQKRLCGREKIYDIAGQWLDCHLDTDNVLPIDQVAEGQDDTLVMLRDLMDEARARQALPHAERSGLDPIWCILEEAPAALADHTRRIEWDGRTWTCSDAVAHLLRTAGSAGIHLVLLAQQYTNAMFGDQASAIKANIGAILIVQSTSGDERSEAFGAGAAKLPNLWNPGQVYIQDGGPVWSFKAWYIHEVDSRMQRLHDGPTIVDVSMARSRIASHLNQGRMITTGSKQWRERPVRMTTEYHLYLRGKSRELPAAPKRTQLSVDDALAALVASKMAEQGITPTSAAPEQPATETDEPTPTAVPVKRSRTAQIVTIVEQATAPISRGDIRAALQADGDDVSVGVLDNTLSKLVAANRLRRADTGLYELSTALQGT